MNEILEPVGTLDVVGFNIPVLFGTIDSFEVDELDVALVVNRFLLVEALDVVGFNTLVLVVTLEVVGINESELIEGRGSFGSMDSVRSTISILA